MVIAMVIASSVLSYSPPRCSQFVTATFSRTENGRLSSRARAAAGGAARGVASANVGRLTDRRTTLQRNLQLLSLLERTSERVSR